MAVGLDFVDLNAFSAEFAHVVTYPTNNDADWVARNGKESIFGVLKEIFPQVFSPCRYTLNPF
jgi:hypothetical protein